MLINLPDDLIMKILLFSFNYELFELYKTCKRFKPRTFKIYPYIIQ